MRAEDEAATPKQSSPAVEQVGEQFDGFTLTTRFDKTIFIDGEFIKVGIRLKSLRAAGQRVQRTSAVDAFSLKVTRADGTAVPLTFYGKQKYLLSYSGASTTVILKPGEEIADSLLVNRIYDLSWSGVYKVTVSSRVPVLGDLTKDTIVTSKTTSIKVEFDG